MSEKAYVDKDDLSKVIEAFWEFTEADGSSLEERQAAWRVQQEAGIKTAWDEARKRACQPAR